MTKINWKGPWRTAILSNEEPCTSVRHDEEDCSFSELDRDEWCGGCLKNHQQHKFLVARTKNKPIYVNVYAIERVYGGPEEGGWWYDTGEPVLTVVCEHEQQAQDVANQLRQEYPHTHDRYSVLGGDDWNIAIEDEPGKEWPSEIPHYE